MKSFFQEAKFYLLAIALSVIVIGLIDVTGIIWESHVGVWRENTKRQVFEETYSYTSGQKRDLANAMYEWGKADAEGKLVIESYVRSAFYRLDPMTLPSDLGAFLDRCRKNY